MHKMKQVLIKEMYSQSKKSDSIDLTPLNICIHTKNDIFGYQELTN